MAGRSQPAGPPRDRKLDPGAAAAIANDITLLGLYGDRAPIRTRVIKGHAPMVEIKTGGYRTFFVRTDDDFVILHICKKQDQDHGIVVADRRMREVLEG